MRTEILKYLILGKSDKEICQALVDSGLSQGDSEKALKEAKASLKKARIPTRKELAVLTCGLICDAAEAEQYSTAQKLLNDLCKIARVDHSVDFELPEFKNSEQYLTALLANVDKLSPAFIGNLSRLMATIRDSKSEESDSEKAKSKETTKPTNEDEAMERILRVIN